MPSQSRPYRQVLVQSFRAAIDPEQERAPEHLLMVYQPEERLRWPIFVGCELTSEQEEVGTSFRGDSYPIDPVKMALPA